MLDDAPIQLLGPVQVGAAGEAPGGPKLQLLLVTLALQPDAVVTTDRLAQVLWADGPPSDPQHALQAQVSKLRKALQAAGVDGAIVHRADGYVLKVAADAVDVHRFETAARSGIDLLEEAPGRAVDVLRGALDEWRGRPLGQFADHPDLRAVTTRLEDLHSRARESLGRARLASGDVQGAVVELQAVVADQPLRESAWSHLLLALYRSGRQAEALAAYDRVRDLLAEELGVDPSPALRDLHTRILRQDASLEAGVPSPDDTVLRTPPARSLAVLPFEVIGSSQDAVHLALGLHSDLLSELSRVPELTVISRTSVVGLGGGDRPVSEIARELGVGVVVEGTVQSAGSRVRLRARLVDARRDAQVWSHAYDGQLTSQNMFALQEELARDLAGALSTELVPRPAATGSVRTDSLDAYRLVAVGRQHLDRKTEEGHRRAIESFQEATRLDAAYVEAWTGLADALVSTVAYGHADRHDLLPRAQRAVHRAIALDPHAADARAALGVLHIAYQDGPAAIGELEHAVRIQPGHAPAHHWLAWVALLLGRSEQAAQLAARALELDPMAAEGHAHMALVHLAHDRPGDGLQAARMARKRSPYTTADLYEGAALYELGRFDDARAVLAPLSVGERGGPGAPWALCAPDAVIALSSVALGDEGVARAVLDDIREVGDDLAAGLVLTALGDLTTATRHLDRVERVGAWPCLAVRHLFASVWERLDSDVVTRLVDVVGRSWGEVAVSER